VVEGCDEAIDFLVRIVEGDQGTWGLQIECRGFVAKGIMSQKFIFGDISLFLLSYEARLRPIALARLNLRRSESA
jgi:hypothetical protein